MVPIIQLPPARHGLRHRRRRRWIGVSLTVGATLIAVLLALSSANGSGGAAAADLLRATIGPSRTAQIESVYLGLMDSWQQMLYRTGAKHVSAPWKTTQSPSESPQSFLHTHLSFAVRDPYPTPAGRPRPTLQSLHTFVSPLLPGEGQWTSSVASIGRREPLPAIARAFIRPDPDRPYAIATILRFDLRQVSLHLVAGTNEPGGPLGMRGSGAIPPTDWTPGVLLAAFNGGFKYADGAYGMMVDHTEYVPPIANAATIAITARGHVIMGAWGQSASLTPRNRNLVSWRQNGLLLMQHGTITPLATIDGDWGTTVLNDAHTWRSALGMTADGALLYVAGNSLSVSTLARTLGSAGARIAMEMDINPFWVRAFLYGEDPHHHLTMASLRPDMQGSPTGFLGPYSRDFLYVTRRVPAR